MSSYWQDRVANLAWKKYNKYEENKKLLVFYKDAMEEIEAELMNLMVKLGERPTLSDMHDYGRLDKLKKRLEDIVGELGKNTHSYGNKQIKESIKDNYKAIMTELGEEDYSLPDRKLMEMMMNNPWSGMNFSERLWENNRILVSNLNEIMTRGLVQGKTIMEMASELNERMLKGFNVAHRLVRTETMHYLNESSKMAYKDAKVKKVQIWAAIDERTCSVCGKEHGEIYDIDKAPILPLHSNCRCTYIPVVNEDRAAKSKEDANIDWKKESVNREYDRIIK